MRKQDLIVAGLTTVLLLSSHALFAKDNQPVYGSQLMTQQERTEFQQRMRNAKSDAERQKIRNEHHKKMQIKAKEQGITLPDKPKKSGAGSGKVKGQGMGEGMGEGKGMGKGMGR